MALQKKNRIHFITKILYITWSLLLALILVLMFYHNYKDANHIAKESAMTSVNKDLAFRSWVASHGGVYVPVTSTTQPNPYLAHIKDRDFFVNNRHYTLMNPAYTLSQMMKDYTKLYGVKTHITSRNLLLC